jgi:hypothetical protein
MPHCSYKNVFSGNRREESEQLMKVFPGTKFFKLHRIYDTGDKGKRMLTAEANQMHLRENHAQ